MRRSGPISRRVGEVDVGGGGDNTPNPSPPFPPHTPKLPPLLRMGSQSTFNRRAHTRTHMLASDQALCIFIMEVISSSTRLAQHYD